MKAKPKLLFPVTLWKWGVHCLVGDTATHGAGKVGSKGWPKTLLHNKCEAADKCISMKCKETKNIWATEIKTIKGLFSLS